MHSRISARGLALAMMPAALFATAASTGAEPSKNREYAKTDPRLERCIKSINAVGASMGHRERKGTEDKPILDFIVRANGSDYRIACEMDSGFLRDIAPNVVHLGDTN